jgi:transposase-like protein
MTRRSAERYSDDERTEALALADEHGAAEASRQTGIAAGTIRRWRHEAGRSGPPSNVDPETWAKRKSAAADETWEAARAALARVHELLGEGSPRSEREAKDAALTLAILLDKSAALEQASAWLHERMAKLGEAQVEALAAALGGVLDDLRLPRTPEVMAVIAHHLRPLEDPDAPRGSAPDAHLAADALRAAVREELLPDEPRSDPPMLALPAGRGEIVRGEVVDGPAESPTPSDEDPYNRGVGPDRVRLR